MFYAVYLNVCEGIDLDLPNGNGNFCYQDWGFYGSGLSALVVVISRRICSCSIFVGEVFRLDYTGGFLSYVNQRRDFHLMKINQAFDSLQALFCTQDIPSVSYTATKPCSATISSTGGITIVFLVFDLCYYLLFSVDLLTPTQPSTTIPDINWSQIMDGESGCEDEAEDDSDSHLQLNLNSPSNPLFHLHLQYVNLLTDFQLWDFEFLRSNKRTGHHVYLFTVNFLDPDDLILTCIRPVCLLLQSQNLHLQFLNKLWIWIHLIHQPSKLFIRNNNCFFLNQNLFNLTYDLSVVIETDFNIISSIVTWRIITPSLPFPALLLSLMTINIQHQLLHDWIFGRHIYNTFFISRSSGGFFRVTDSINSDLNRFMLNIFGGNLHPQTISDMAESTTATRIRSKLLFSARGLWIQSSLHVSILLRFSLEWTFLGRPGSSSTANYWASSFDLWAFFHGFSNEFLYFAWLMIAGIQLLCLVGKNHFIHVFCSPRMGPYLITEASKKYGKYVVSFLITNDITLGMLDSTTTYIRPHAARVTRVHTLAELMDVSQASSSRVLCP